jgi:epoxyqueuosine reductase
VPAEELRQAMGDWFFGCDLCQTVCPWNQKIFRNQLSTAFIEPHANSETLEKELRWILTSSGKQLEKAFAVTPLSRAGSFGLKRNALVVVANRGMASLAPEVEALCAHPKLGELATWTLKRFATSVCLP